MRTVPHCPACGGTSFAVTASIDSQDRHQRFLEFSTVKYDGLLNKALADVQPIIDRCNVCGHCWYRHQPEPGQLGLMYAAGRPLLTGAQRSREPSPAMTSEMARLRQLAEVGGSDSTLLDYGSGYGRWARAAVQAGFQVTAFEPSCERGAEAGTPFELVHSLETLKGRRFTAIQLEQVLEHVPDPLATLSDLKAFCDTHTIVRITVPNMLRTPEGSSLWDRWPFDGRVPHTMAPFEHLHGFTPQSLQQLLRRAGFRPLKAIRLLQHCPTVPLRSLLGKAFPALGTTHQFVRTH